MLLNDAGYSAKVTEMYSTTTYEITNLTGISGSKDSILPMNSARIFGVLPLQSGYAALSIKCGSVMGFAGHIKPGVGRFKKHSGLREG